MDSQYLLLVQNQNNLDKLRVRIHYYTNIITSAKFDTHKQYGPYSDYWEEWLDHADLILGELHSDVVSTAQFVSEFRDFIMSIKDTDNKSQTERKRTKEMLSFANEAIACQRNMIHMADERISEHREFTHKLMLVEALDSLNDD